MGKPMNNDYAVIAENVCKTYKIYDSPNDRMKDFLLPGKYGEEFHALWNVNFCVPKGEVVGLIGLNGSGKSTLSNLIAGISEPSRGRLIVQGEAALINISSGLNNNLTGLENIELKGMMIGMNRQQIREIQDKIIDFAEIGRFINQPVKTYSSGMKSRLGFAISVNIDPDILIIDEALSVGDMTFAEKSLKKMQEFRNQGKTIFFVSHSIGQIKSFCTKAIWLEYGLIKAYGDVAEVTPMYERFARTFNKMSPKEREAYRKGIFNEGNI